MTKILLLIIACACVNVEAQTNKPWMTSTSFFVGSIMVISNLNQPAQFEPRGVGITTNIVISTNYTGTIQIGPNIYTRKDFADLAVIPKGNYDFWRNFRASMNGTKPTNTVTTKWLGFAITGEAFGGGSPEGLRDLKASDAQIGLRPDGVVVWRKRE